MLLNSYLSIYYSVMGFALLIALIYVAGRHKGIRFTGFAALATAGTAVFAIVYFGTRGADIGSDTANYLSIFNQTAYDLASRHELRIGSDTGFYAFIRLAALCGFSDRAFLFLCSALLVVPLIATYRKVFPDEYFLPFLMLACSFFFTNFGINIIRQGIAYSFLLLAVVNQKILWKVLCGIVAVSFHLSVLLPAVLYLVFLVVRPRPWAAFIIWGACFTAVFLDLEILPMLFEGIGSETLSGRAASYLNSANQTYQTGFRLDFVAFGLFFAAFGLWARRKIGTDRFYDMILSMYILLNAVFMLAMKFPYSDRTGILSWGLIPILFSYPLFRYGGRRHTLAVWGGGCGMLILSCVLQFI